MLLYYSCTLHIVHGTVTHVLVAILVVVFKERGDHIESPQYLDMRDTRPGL